MSWGKVWLVLRREYLYYFRRPSFLFSAFGVPIISIVAMFLIFQFTAERESNLSDYQRVGYVDRANAIIHPEIVPDRYVAVTDPALTPPDAEASSDEHAAYYDALEEAARAALIEGDLDAYFVIDANYILTGQVELFTPKNSPAALHDDIETMLHDQIAADTPHSLRVPRAPVIRDIDSGEELSDTALIGRLMVPFVFVLLYFMATNTTAQFLVSGVVEEKENRLMEILATSIRPLELLWGKMLGLGALALTQVAIWGGAGLLILMFNEDAQDFISGVTFRAEDIALIVGLFLLSFLLFAAIMLGIGAAVTTETESRQIAGLFTFVTVLPLMLLSMFFTNPDGPLPLFFTFFPLTSAIGLTMRLGMTTLPAWQIVLSVALLIASVIAVMWLAAKVFRLGMLMYGKPLTPRALVTALRQGQTILTTEQTESPARTARSRRKRSLLRR